MPEMLVRQEPASASAVRRELALDLDLQGVGEDSIDDTALVLSELLGNAIRHCESVDRDELGVIWTVHPNDVVVSVEDSSELFPVARQAPPDAPHGRGLAIIERLSAAWGVERTQRGKRVWAKIALPARP
jgi:anti-sigma regulatory factor (Ser/Thr protein kinase)